jgi:hypothetical protein
MVIWILIVVMLGVGIFALRGSVKNSFKNVELKNSKARMVQSILGEEGYRYFVGAIGVVFVAAALGLIVIIVGGKNLMNSDDSETDIMKLTVLSDDSTVTSTLWSTEAQLITKHKILGDSIFDKYQHISLKNNYRSKLPDLLWKMTNIESIDLTNNDFTELPLQEFVKLPKLRKLILNGNPVEQAYIQQIRSKLSGIEVIKNEVAKP